ncbi:hypothetical protein CW304_11070 [Bacillus sp. UFRGS-B20]|nr:hypothetical protein CW304_11070 [Bacillus sp. UFRGS-B20]
MLASHSSSLVIGILSRIPWELSFISGAVSIYPVNFSKRRRILIIFFYVLPAKSPVDAPYIINYFI